MGGEMDYSIIRWIKAEIDGTLNQARQALEAYLEHTQDEAALHSCAALLKQARGALQMVELAGGAMLAQHMEQLAVALAEDEQCREPQAYEVLIRSMLVLGNYLEWIQGGHEDTPLALLPMLNELRIACKVPALAESALFAPDLSIAPAQSGFSPSLSPPSLSPNDEGVEPLARRLRPMYESALVGWLRNRDEQGSLKKIGQIMRLLEQACTLPDTQRVWWIIGGLVEALLDRGLEASLGLKRMFGHMDRLIKILGEFGEQGLVQALPEELIRNLLYHAAKATSGGERISALKQAYRLETVLVPESVLEEIRQSLGAPAAGLLASVSPALLEDLAKVKDALDMLARQGGWTRAALQPIEATLLRLADTLDMLGLERVRQLISEQAGRVQALFPQEGSAQEGPQDTSQLAAMASDLLYAESLLNNAFASGRTEGPRDDESVEDRELLASVIHVAKADMQQVMEVIDAYARAPQQQPDLLKDVPVLFKRINGALSMLALTRAAGLLEACNRYITREILESRAVLSPSALETLADALTGLDQYLEALGENRQDRQLLLDRVDRSLAHMGYALEAGTTAAETPFHALEELLSAAPAAEPAPEVGTAEPQSSSPQSSSPQLFSPELPELPALPIASLAKAGAVLQACDQYIGRELLEKTSLPAQVTLEMLSDALLLVEQYLHALERREAQSPDVLAEMEQRLSLLAEVFAPRCQPEPQQPVEVPEQGPAPLQKLTILEGIDPDLVEVFLEEAQEQADSIAEQVSLWHGRPEEAEHLTKLRRSFHTLKGSGRTVGARDLGEFAWAFENMLNRVIDGTVAPSPAILDLIGQTPEALIQLIAQLRGAGIPSVDIEVLAQRAHALAQPGVHEVAPPVLEPEPNIPEPVIEQEALPEIHFEITMPVEVPSEIPQPVEEQESAAIPAAIEEPVLSSAPAMEPTAEATSPTAPEPVRAPSPLETDRELAEIFFQEAVDLLDANESTLASWIGDPDNTYWRGEMQRSLHTLKGSARMAGVKTMGDFSHSLESLLVAAAEGRLPASGSLFNLMQDGNDRLVRMLETVRAGQTPEPAEDLLPRIEEMLCATPLEQVEREPAAETALVPDSAIQPEQALDLRTLFLEQADGLLQTSEAMLRNWLSEPENARLSAELSRTIRTLRSGARAAALQPIDTLGERLGSLLTAVVTHRVETSVRVFETLQAAYAGLAEMLRDESNNIPATAATELIHQIDELLAVRPEARVEAQQTGAAGQAAADRPQYEQVRIRASLLDKLVNFAAEISIYHARLRQQVHTFHGAIGEFEETNRRIQEQLRRLSMETEAQMLFRHQDAVGQDYALFDPLELDRYSLVQQLSRGMSESVSDLDNIRALLDGVTKDSEMLLLQQGRVHTELQEGLMRTRMLPFAVLVPRIRRVVRQVSAELGKSVNLHVEGDEHELDRTVLDKIVAPIEHILRNAIDHGLEAPELRQAQGKAASGLIGIRLHKEGTEVVLELADDGAGIDLEAVRRKAVERGMLAPDAELSDQELMQFIMESGLSTAAHVSQVSGRGVGMDVVHSVVKQLGGALSISSSRGRGTIFTIRLPLMLSITQALVTNVGEEIYAVPLAHIQAVTQVRQEELERYFQSAAPQVEYAGEPYQLMSLGSLLDCPASLAPPPGTKLPLLLVRSGDMRVALHVDGLIGRREIVVKSLGPQLSSVKGLMGATILGDGRVALILDTGTLVRKAVSQIRTAARAAAATDATLASKGIKVMVVDDSITIRKVTARLLERHHMQVRTAKDGVDALEQFQEQIPDVIVLDIEMPRMDGYELARHIRHTPELKHLPIIMITSRIGDKHRHHAEEIGVDRYLGKPYQESELLENIRGLLKERR